MGHFIYTPKFVSTELDNKSPTTFRVDILLYGSKSLVEDSNQCHTRFNYLFLEELQTYCAMCRSVQNRYWKTYFDSITVMVLSWESIWWFSTTTRNEFIGRSKIHSGFSRTKKVYLDYLKSRWCDIWVDKITLRKVSRVISWISKSHLWLHRMA